MPRQLENSEIAESSGLHLWLILWKAHAAVREFAAADIARLGLSLTDFGILESLLHKGPLAVNDIGKKVLLTSGSMTAAIDRLTERGLVERRDVLSDRRARIVHLTTTGRKTITAAFAKHTEAMNALGDDLTMDERREAIRVLKKLGFAAASRVVA